MERPVAVRSSSTTEDLEALSHAGQYDSILHVQPRVESVLRAVRQCWASMYSERVIAYRAALDPDGRPGRMGVIVQEMVRAECAGVLFTADPLGSPRVAVIEAARGLGDAVVSGRTTPERLLVDRASAQVDRAEFRSRGRRHQRLVGDSLASELVRLGMKIEGHFGVPQDIEWAVEDGEPFILQARPLRLRPDFLGQVSGYLP